MGLGRTRQLRFERFEDRRLLSAQDLSYIISPGWFGQVEPSISIEAPPPKAVAAQSDLAKADKTDQWIVQFNQRALSSLSSVEDSRALLDDGQAFELVEGLGRVGQVLITTGGDADGVAKWLSANPYVEYFERNEAVWSIDAVPNDSRLPELWGMNNTGQTGGLADADIDAEEAWDLTTGNSSVVVGIIDTGVDYNHPDLAANIWTNPGEVAGNGVDDDGNGFVDDIHGYDFVNNDGNPIDDAGHGTHVAGTIAAAGNNNTGVVGVNWSSSIMALKFLDAGGSGNTANAVRAVNYATLMRQQYGVNIHVTNNSWGGGGFNAALRDAINAGGNAGILFVAAAGNDSENTDATPAYPAGYNVASIISVAATDHRDVLANFSNYGAQTVDLAAPGVDVLSTLPNNTYGKFSGTSMATPHVTGVAALAWALSPSASVSQIRDAIIGSTDPVAALAGRMVSGGRLNARRTLEQLGMNVLATAPAAGATLAVPPLSFEVSFTNAFDPQTLDASDFLVNGIAAAVVTAVDGDSVVFSFVTSPVTTQGPQAMSMPQGALTRQSDADPLRAWQSSFYYDLVPTAVVSSQPPEGATVASRPSAIVLEFNEPIDTTSVGVEDLKLDGGIVIAATALGPTTVRYDVSGLIEDGSVRFELKPGAVLDVHGNSAPTYVGHFTIDDPLISHYRAIDVPRTIPDLRTTTSVLQVPSSVSIADLDVALDISHTFDADLDVTLIAPDGTRIELFSDVGGSGANFVGTILDDEATSPIPTGAAPFTGRFRPEGLLSAVDGMDATGTWALEVKDDAGADVGTLNGWEIIVRQSADLPPRITAVAPLPLDHGRTWKQIDSLSVQFSEAVQPEPVNGANWELREAGADQLFDTPDDVLHVISTSPAYAGGLSANLVVADGPLAAGSYRFTASSALVDLTGNPLDGNGDRTGGDAYVRYFSMIAVLPDRFEPNDDFAHATELGIVGSRTEEDLTLHAANNNDFYRFTADITGAITADVIFNQAEGDVDIALYDVNETLLTESVSLSDNERILAAVTAGQSYYLRVYAKAGDLSPNYRLELVVSQTPAGDRFEPNDSFAAAFNFGALASRTEPNLSIHFPDNDDYYRFTPSLTGTLTVDILFTHSAGDIDAALYDANQTRLTYSDSRSNNERIVWHVIAGQQYYLRVFGYGGAINPSYTLQLLVSQAPVADRFEPNDNFDAATDLGSILSRTEASLSIHAPDNEDYYRFTSEITGSLTADVFFIDSAGDIDVALFDENQDYLSSSESTSDNEHIVWSVVAGETYYFQVYGYEGAINPNYSLQLVVSQASAGDRFEPNDTFSQATDLGTLGSRTEPNLSIHFSGNGDFYRFTPAATGTLNADFFFRHADGDIDVTLYDSNQVELESSDSSSDNESIVYNVIAGRTYYLEVYGYDGETNPNYALDVSVGVRGTPGNDLFYLKPSSDGATLEVYNVYPLNPGSTPIFAWPMNASVSLPIVTLGGDDKVLIDIPEGASGPAAGLKLDTGAGANNQLFIRGGNVRVDGVSTAGILKTTLEPGTQVSTSRLAQSSLTLSDNSQLTLLPGGQTSLLTSLTIGTGATLDITNNALVIDYTGASPVTAIRDKILSGRGGAGLGKGWNGTGLSSSTAAQGNQTDPESRAVGYAENAQLPLGAYSNFRGLAVDNTAVLIAYTRTADANLDGVVNDNDVTILGANYAPGIARPTWALGDFEYNGLVNDDDVTLLGAFYNPGAAPLPARLAAGVQSDGVQSDGVARAVAPPPDVIRSVTWASDHVTSTTQFVALSANRAVSSTEGLLFASSTPETSGQSVVRGPETRAQPEETRAQRKDANDSLDLVAQAIAFMENSAYQAPDRPRARSHAREAVWDAFWMER